VARQGGALTMLDTRTMSRSSDRQVRSASPNLPVRGGANEQSSKTVH
jgi:hypothetical protein